MIDCLLKGEVLYDPENKLVKLHERLLSFPVELKCKNVLEFAALLKCHLESKLLLKEGHLLDAYLAIQKASSIGRGWRQSNPVNIPVSGCGHR